MAYQRVMIVEDDLYTRNTLTLILESEGYEVLQAANGREALNLLLTQPLPQIILLDLRMPVMNGWEFRQRQRQDARLAGIPVVVISGVEDIRHEAEQVGAATYLTKPVSPEYLLETLRTLGGATSRAG